MKIINNSRIDSFWLPLVCCGLLVCVFLVKTCRRPRHSDTMEAAAQGERETKPDEIYNVPIPASNDDWPALEQKYRGALPNYEFSHDEILAFEHMYHWAASVEYRITNKEQALALEQRYRYVPSYYGVNACVWLSMEELEKIDIKAIKEKWRVQPEPRFGGMKIPTRAVAIIYLLRGRALPLSVPPPYCLGAEDDEYFYLSKKENGINDFSHGTSVRKINGEIAYW